MTTFCCRACGAGSGRLILDLGNQPLANRLLTQAELGAPEPRFPLRLAACESCWLLQIIDLVPPADLFSDYLYFSSFSDALLRHSAAAVERHIRDFQLGPQSRVIEIASNDGYLLKNFVAAGIPCLGIEPAANIAKVATERGIPTLCRFFGEELAKELTASNQQADLILANNVFAHVPDINGFVAGIATLLQPGGRAVIEFPYGCDMVEHVEFDTIYHEHVFYFTLTALVPLMARHGMEVFNVERLAIHGGSLRLSIARTGTHTVLPAVATLAAEERSKGVGSAGYYDDFGRRVQGIKQDLIALLDRLQSEGKSIAAYGASAKGSTLLNFYGLDSRRISFVVDRSTAKQGRFTPGTHIPIVPPEELVRRRPDYAVLLTWNFAEEILAQQQAYRDAGGHFIVPVPTVRVV